MEKFIAAGVLRAMLRRMREQRDILDVQIGKKNRKIIEDITADMEAVKVGIACVEETYEFIPEETKTE